MTNCVTHQCLILIKPDFTFFYFSSNKCIPMRLCDPMRTRFPHVIHQMDSLQTSEKKEHDKKQVA